MSVSRLNMILSTVATALCLAFTASHARYLAARMTRSKRLGSLGVITIPPVTIFMDATALRWHPISPRSSWLPG